MPRGRKVFGYEHAFHFKIFILCTGNVPATIGNLTNLTKLFLNNNNLSGACVLSDQFNKQKPN